MEHSTHDIDIAALEAEVNAIEAAAAVDDERIEALLRTGSPAVVMADLALQMELGRRELDVQERYQRRIQRALG